MTAQRPADALRALPWDEGPARLYAGAVRHLAARALLSCTRALRDAADALTRLRWRLEDGDPTARNRAVATRHPSTFPYAEAPLRTVPTPDGPMVGYGCTVIPLSRATGHGASEGDPSL